MKCSQFKKVSVRWHARCLKAPWDVGKKPVKKSSREWGSSIPSRILLWLPNPRFAKVPFSKIKHPPINDFQVNIGSPISRQILNGFSEARQDEIDRHEETAKSTIAMTKFMEAQVELTRLHMQSSIDNDKFNKRMLGWTLIVGSLTIIATVVFGISSLR